MFRKLGPARLALAAFAARAAAIGPAARAARAALDAIDAYGAVAVAAAAPPRNTSVVYGKAPAAKVSLGTMVAEAARWADEATAARDPVRVRDRLGMKGCKHFAEYLDLQRLAAAFGDGRARARADRAVRAAVAAEAYHAFLGRPAGSRRFREDSMSYLRALWLAGELGVGGDLAARWRARAAAAVPALWRHLPSRGVDQRLNFAKLLRDLDLATEADLVALERRTLRETHISRRRPLAWFLAAADRPYDLTHEVFALTRDGRGAFPAAGDPAATFAVDSRGALAAGDPEGPAPDHAYALATAAALLKVCVRRDALDAACELLANLGQLGARAGAGALGELYRQAQDYVASRRNADGSFGETHDAVRVRAAKRNPAYDVEVGGTLHTTYVCLWALAQPELAA